MPRLPGIQKASLAMPDIHWGYGFAIGGVAATDPEEGGVISPGGVGYDINCGVRLAQDRHRVVRGQASHPPACRPALSRCADRSWPVGSSIKFDKPKLASPDGSRFGVRRRPRLGNRA